jgi:hypothetical protein
MPKFRLCFIPETNPKEPNHSLRRSFKVENAGVLPVHVTSAQINRHACGGHGFTVLDCQDFIIQPNSSRELVIL